MPSNHLILCHLLLLLPSTFPRIRVFSVSQLFTSGGQRIGASVSVLPMNIQGLFPLGWTGWIPLQSKGVSGVFSSTTKASILQHSAFFMVQLSHPHMTTGKAIALTIWSFVGKVLSLLFNTLPKFVIAFLSRRKHLLNLWLQLLSTVILEPKKIKPVSVSTFPPSTCPGLVMGHKNEAGGRASRSCSPWKGGKGKMSQVL